MRSTAAKLDRVCALISTVLAVACVREEPGEPRATAREEMVWNFPTKRGKPKLRLWPSESSTPERLKRSMTTENDHGRLSARVSGNDPYFVWRFGDPIAARLVSIEVEAQEAGPLQIYWSSAACPTFRESCTMQDVVSAGRQWIDFLTDGTVPIRELRLDLPDKVGTTLWFYNIVIFESAELGPRWAGRADVVELDERPSGLRVAATAPDPWITVTTPGLVATRFDTVEVIVRGDVTVNPQLFWQGPCQNFDESCSVHFRRAESGPLTHVADLSKVATWRGPITALRFDPAEDASTYTIERIALSRTPASPKPRR